MKAYVLEEINKFNIKDVDIPECTPGEVFIQVKAAGICGSDIPRVYRTGTYHYPLIPGHEFSGEVVKACDEDREFVGKRFGIFPLIPCMKCEQCRKKQYEMCTDYSYLGSRTDGGFAEYVKVPIWNLIELPENVTYRQAAMLEPMSVAVHAARNAGVLATKNGDATYDKNIKIAVMGLGTIGLALVMFLLGEGYKNIIAIGNKEIQKKAALDLGLSEDKYVDSKDYKPGDELIDVFFECVGTQAVLDVALNSTVQRGKIVCVGNPASDMTISQKSYWQILRKQFTLVGTWNSSFTHEEDDDWHYVIEKISEGALHPEKLITHSYDFEDLISGFEIMRDKSEEYIKVMMTSEQIDK